MFVFTHLLQELRLDCTVKNGPGLLLGLFLFPPQHNFPPVNWSVFASLSTPAKQHLPWSYRISIRSFPNVALSQLQCFCSYTVASLWSLLSLHAVCRCCFGETCLVFLWRSLFSNSPPCFMLFNSKHFQELMLHMLTDHRRDAQSNSEPCFENNLPCSCNYELSASNVVTDYWNGIKKSLNNAIKR